MIVNLTQHSATPEQRDAGVVDITDEAMQKELVSCLSFEEIPTQQDLWDRAYKILLLAENVHADAAMIGGAPYLMPKLEKMLNHNDILPLYAFSKRESVDEPQPDGSTKKTTIFRHLGFVEG